jgi:hypothetical protein
MKGDDRFFLIDSNKAPLESLIQARPALSKANLVRSKHPDLQDALLEYEQRNLQPRQFKMGVMLVKPGQSNEDQWYSNRETSEEYEEFLSWLGERVTLQGWTKFRGGLNITSMPTRSLLLRLSSLVRWTLFFALVFVRSSCAN